MDLLQESDAVFPREKDVQNDDVETLLLQEGESLFAGNGCTRLPAFVSQDTLECGPNPGLIINNKYLRWFHVRNSKVNFAPERWLLSRVMRPRCSCMICEMMERPSPEPFSFVET